MENEKIVKYDLDGYEAVTSAIMELINQYPEFYKEEILFSSLNEDGGMAIYPITGPVIETETKNVIGETYQVCLYPFVLIYRGALRSSERKEKIKEMLDNIGKWLEKQTVTINDNDYTLSEYPPLTDNRKFLSITRQSPSFMESASDNGVEDWVINISARYSNEF